jgi:hypothetical protein
MKLEADNLNDIAVHFEWMAAQSNAAIVSAKTQSKKRDLTTEAQTWLSAARMIRATSMPIFAAANGVVAYDWSDNDDDAVAAIEALRSAVNRS